MRVLISTQPAFSHAAQMIPLARELERRGHVVTVATSATFVATLVGHGLDARPFGLDWMIRPGDEVYERTVGQQTFFGFPQVSDQSSVDDLLHLARDTRAELIVREYAEFAGWAVARSLGIPLVTQGIIHRLPPPGEARVVELAGRVAALAGVEPPRTADDLLGSAYLDWSRRRFAAPGITSSPLSRARRARPRSMARSAKRRRVGLTLSAASGPSYTRPSARSSPSSRRFGEPCSRPFPILTSTRS